MRISTRAQSGSSADDDSIIPYASMPKHRFSGILGEATLIRGGWFIPESSSAIPGTNFWNLRTGERYRISSDVVISSFVIIRDSRGKYVLYAGTIDGRLGTALFDQEIELAADDQLPVRVTTGPITAVDALDKNLIVTGGSDRCIRVWHSVGSETKKFRHSI